MARKSRKSKGVTVDLSGIETSRGTLPEGQYLVSVNETSLEESRNSGSNYIKFVFEVTEGNHKGAKLFHNCSLQPQALFNLKAVLAALGFEIPNKAFDLDINELVGLECSVEVTHEMYEGKKKARITEFMNPDGDIAEDEEEEAGEIEELLEELEMDQLKELATEVGIKKAALKKAKDEDDLIDLLLEEDEDEVQEAYDELFGDDEEEEEETPEDDEEDDEDYESMSLKELKQECKERGLKVKKGMTKEDLVEMLEEDDEEL